MFEWLFIIAIGALILWWFYQGNKRYTGCSGCSDSCRETESFARNEVNQCVQGKGNIG